MSTSAAPLQFVLSSSVRSDVLRAVADGTRTTDALLDAVDASSSAVYDALGRLEEAALLRSAGEEWSLTGSGRIVADCVCERYRIEHLLDRAGCYLATHDACAIPEPFRRRLGELAGGEVIRASSTEPQAVFREIRDRLERADRALVVTPIYDELYEAVLPETAETRVVVDPVVVDSVAADLDTTAEIESGLEAYAPYDIRVREANFALAVTDSALLLSLPLLEGDYDTQSEFVAERESARRWGQDLFEALWTDGEPLDAYVHDRHL